MPLRFDIFININICIIVTLVQTVRQLRDICSGGNSQTIVNHRIMAKFAKYMGPHTLTMALVMAKTSVKGQNVILLTHMADLVSGALCVVGYIVLLFLEKKLFTIKFGKISDYFSQNVRVTSSD